MKTDAQIKADVLEELKWVPHLDKCDIHVDVSDGIVSLSGIVDSYNNKIAAEHAANSIQGTKGVAVNLRVNLLRGEQKTDAELESIILDTFKWHSGIHEKKLRVEVRDGWVTLAGESEWEHERVAARRAVENLAGVCGITDLIEIVPHSYGMDVKENIAKAFHRNASIDASRIHIEQKDSIIILEGKVRSVDEKRSAVRAAWFSPGVKEVKDLLEVESDLIMA